MDVTFEPDSGVCVPVVCGMVDGQNADDFRSALESGLDESDGGAVLDLARLDYISSAGLRVILSVAQRIRSRGDKMALCCLTDTVLPTFRISGFDRIIVTRGQAVAALGG